MNHLTAWAITITAFSSGLYSIYKVIRAKYVSYDTTPIHYWLNKKQKIKKRYKTFRKHKANKRNKLTKYTKISKLDKKYIGKLNFVK
jgi:hypothetical protein